MPIEIRRPRKGKRLVSIQPKTGDLRDIVVGSLYATDIERGLLVIGELPTFPADQPVPTFDIATLQDIGNVVIFHIKDMRTCDMLIEKIAAVREGIQQFELRRSKVLVDAMQGGLILGA